jgi:hypothetical protein
VSRCVLLQLKSRIFYQLSKAHFIYFLAFSISAHSFLSFDPSSQLALKFRVLCLAAIPSLPSPQDKTCQQLEEVWDSKITSSSIGIVCTSLPSTIYIQLICHIPYLLQQNHDALVSPSSLLSRRRRRTAVKPSPCMTPAIDPTPA